jgi:hypothetical protein
MLIQQVLLVYYVQLQFQEHVELNVQIISGILQPQHVLFAQQMR